MRVTLAAALAATMLWVNAVQAEGYVCVPFMAIGFVYDNERDTWKERTFEAKEKVLIVRPADESWTKDSAWVVRRRGWAESVCKEEFNKQGGLRCEGGSEFIFNRKDGGYARAVLYGSYPFDPKPTHGEIPRTWAARAPYLEVGKCTELP